MIKYDMLSFYRQWGSGNVKYISKNLEMNLRPSPSDELRLASVSVMHG